jgi:hypothetical protein
MDLYIEAFLFFLYVQEKAVKKTNANTIFLGIEGPIRGLFVDLLYLRSFLHKGANNSLPRCIFTEIFDICYTILRNISPRTQFRPIRPLILAILAVWPLLAL